MSMSYKKIAFLALMGIIPATAIAIDNPHFYKAPYLNATKSWKEKEWLGIFDAHYAHGSTRDNPFDLYGNHNLLYLSTNVPKPNGLSAALEGYIDALEATRISFESDNPTDKQCFGQVGFCGECEVDEFVFNYRQNLACNFFMEFNMPVRRVKSGPKTLVDKTPVGSTDNPDYTQQDTTWTDFRDNLDDIIRAYGLEGYACSSKTSSLGDIALLAGWQRRVISGTEMLEYLDLAIKAGVLFPTGAHRRFNQPFSIENGYNDHLGFPVHLDAIFGISNDIYLGTYLGLIIFSSKTHPCYPVKTHGQQNGFIKLYTAKIREKKGTLLDIGAHLKLDHFLKGLSLLVGYSYNRQASDTLSIDACEETNNVIINSDCRLKDWYMHVLHLLAEYDFGEHNSFKKRRWQPRISIFYDYPFSGNRIISNAMLGGSIGFDFSWKA